MGKISHKLKSFGEGVVKRVRGDFSPKHWKQGHIGKFLRSHFYRPYHNGKESKGKIAKYLARAHRSFEDDAEDPEIYSYHSARSAVSGYYGNPLSGGYYS